ncbi:hypothetical protein [uncultured Rikenella sp.]|uniref:hypothetical protein n=1 Tax=uncultured Rikenella sp. TaxID=368003 RepID=UPI0025EB8B7B|nr:hypothetical protein [uncultured Rikenella sp.]
MREYFPSTHPLDVLLRLFLPYSQRADKRFGPSAAGGCVSIRLKFFWFFLFTTDATSEGNANKVCKLPSGEEENKRSEVKKNSTRPGNDQIARHALR